MLGEKKDLDRSRVGFLNYWDDNFILAESVKGG
jgi:hypothetical protein